MYTTSMFTFQSVAAWERGYLTTWYLEFYASSEMTVMATAVRCQAIGQLTSRSLVSVVKRVCTSASEKSPKITVYSEKNRTQFCMQALFSWGHSSIHCRLTNHVYWYFVCNLQHDWSLTLVTQVRPTYTSKASGCEVRLTYIQCHGYNCCYNNAIATGWATKERGTVRSRPDYAMWHSWMT